MKLKRIGLIRFSSLLVFSILLFSLSSCSLFLPKEERAVRMEYNSIAKSKGVKLNDVLTGSGIEGTLKQMKKAFADGNRENIEALKGILNSELDMVRNSPGRYGGAAYEIAGEYVKSMIGIYDDSDDTLQSYVRQYNLDKSIEQYESFCRAGNKAAATTVENHIYKMLSGIKLSGGDAAALKKYVKDAIAEIDRQYGIDKSPAPRVVGTAPSSPTGSASSLWVEVTGTYVNLRLGPSLNSSTWKNSYGYNVHPNKYDRLQYLGESGDFYNVLYKGKSVWISKQYGTLRNSGTSGGSSRPAATQSTANSGRKVVVTGTYVNLRLGPSLSSSTWKNSYGYNVHPNKYAQLEYLGESGDFYNVLYKGKSVWISKQYSMLQ